jgi:dsRNA-specific ribonuclease
MEINSKLKEFFNLEEKEEEYQYAITPKSCGGGDEFKLLALLGDRVLNLELYDVLTNEGITDSGNLTLRLNNYIHNEDILYLVGKVLKIDEIMIPTDINHQISKGELKESVEALIGANFKGHGFGPHKEIIKKLYKIIKKIEENIKIKKQTQIYYENPIGKLQELFDKVHVPLPHYDVRSVNAIDTLPPFKCILTATFDEKDYRIESILTNTKPEARKDAATKFLMILEGKADLDKILEPPEKIIKIKENKIQEEIPEDIRFLKLSSEGQPDQIKLSSGTGETLYQWAVRYAEKRPFAMLILLSYRIDTFSGCSWHASIPNGELIFSYNTFDGNEYYEIGFGTSKTKAKKDAARKFIKTSKLFDWLEANYKDKML